VVKTDGLKVNIEVGTDVLKAELKVIHKHIGAMLDELENICPNCGSNDVEEITLRYFDGEKGMKQKSCAECGEGWFDKT